MQLDATKKYHEFLGAITHHSADGIIAFSGAGQIILANAAVSRILGYDVSELEQMSLQSVLGDEFVDGPALVRFFGGVDASEEAKLPIPMRAVHKSGDPVSIEIAVGCATLSDGEKVYVASCRDITQRLEIEARLNTQAEIIRQMRDVMVVADADFIIHECNQEFLRFVRASRDRVLGASMFDLMEIDFVDRLDPDEVRKTVFEQGNWTGLVEIRTKRSKKIVADVAVFRISGLFDSEIMFGFVARDVTERIESQERINQTQKIEALGRLAGGVAHDINNLLFPIFLNLEMATEDMEPYEGLKDTRDDIREAMDACLKIKSMVQHILLFSRKNSLETMRLDIAEEVEEAWGLAKLVVPTSIERKVEIASNCGTFIGNSVQFSQLILNLISNAVAAMEKIGTLTISLRRVQVKGLPRPKYFRLRSAEAAEIVVADTGSGIEEDILDKIFDPFFTTKEVGQGTGLGLTEVASIVQALGGAIDLESQVGQGTTFKVYLPIDED